MPRYYLLMMNGSAAAGGTMADKINAALAAGDTVVATVYAGATEFGPKWAGRFSMATNGRDIVLNRGKRNMTFLASGTRWTAYSK